MEFRILHLIDGASKAEGLTVVIDVFRAFSLACYLFDRGAEKIIPVGNLNVAYRIKDKNPGFILIGERDNRKMPGFDYGNSPFEIKDRDFSGRTIIHTTSAGTQGISVAVNAAEIITGSFVNAAATTDYIRRKDPAVVSLVCMGYSARRPVEEDDLFAEYIRLSLEGKNPDFGDMVGIIRKTSGKRFFDPANQEHCPKEDFDLCLDLDRFGFIIKAKKDEQGRIVLLKE